MAAKSTGIMLASQVCDRLVASQKLRRPTSERARHHLEVSNYFHRAPERTPPGGTTRRAAKPAPSPEAPAPAAAAVAAGPGPATPPIPPEPAPAAPEPAPTPRVQIDPEVIVSWGSWTRAELYAQAKELDIRGRSSMTKKMLLKALVAYVRGAD